MTGFSDNPFDKLRSRPDAEVWSASGAVQVGMGEAPVSYTHLTLPTKA